MKLPCTILLLKTQNGYEIRVLSFGASVIHSDCKRGTVPWECLVGVPHTCPRNGFLYLNAFRVSSQITILLLSHWTDILLMQRFTCTPMQIASSDFCKGLMNESRVLLSEFQHRIYNSHVRSDCQWVWTLSTPRRESQYVLGDDKRSENI
ncbi:hypothetical protein CDAR_212351 [Caerostris darwini]|uniref:Uncharacterized protein n=1 Tax=Caerostris darwini TaxID=1538125 RepID=A0AAV4SDU2_9ARAC|nr:hypothetical protein CDAR_212351 [Caerostris darwini]